MSAAVSDNRAVGMRILGLTGSIAMGKSTTARMFRLFGVPLFDADAAVHRTMAPGGAAAAAVGAAFPGVQGEDGGIDRGRLGRLVLGDKLALARLEALLHPLVREGERRFLERSCRHGALLVVLDVPLLYETGGEVRFDAVCVATAPSWLQERRVLTRPGMSGERFAAVKQRQMADGEKRRRADFVVRSGAGRGAALAEVRGIVGTMLARPARLWPHRWHRAARV